MLSQHVCQTVIINASGSNNAEQCSSKQQHIGLGMFESISVAAVLPQSCTHSVFASNKFKSGGTQYWQKLHNHLAFAMVLVKQIAWQRIKVHAAHCTACGGKFRYQQLHPG